MLPLLAAAVACGAANLPRTGGTPPATDIQTAHSPTSEPTQSHSPSPTTGDAVFQQPAPGPAEEVLPPLGFRPNLLLLLYEPGTRESEEIYGYDLATGQLGQLTEGGPGPAGEIAPSPDGDIFAYLRKPEGGPGSNPAGLCIRPLQGGTPACQWDVKGYSLTWRPGTWDLYVTGDDNLTVYQVDTQVRSPSKAPGGIPYVGGFSPDGRWLTYRDKGMVLVSLEPGGKTVRLAEVISGGGEWIAADKLLVLHSDPKERSSELLTVGLTNAIGLVPGGIARW